MFEDRSEERKRERKAEWRLRHVCHECGHISKVKLAAAHPTKAGNVCEPCRKKLWDGEE